MVYIASYYRSKWLQVYDAKTMSETPVAKVEMPQRVPLGFHGTFVHQEQLNQQHESHTHVRTASDSRRGAAVASGDLDP